MMTMTTTPTSERRAAWGELNRDETLLETFS